MSTRAFGLGLWNVSTPTRNPQTSSQSSEELPRPKCPMQPGAILDETCVDSPKNGMIVCHEVHNRGMFSLCTPCRPKAEMITCHSLDIIFLQDTYFF